MWRNLTSLALTAGLLAPLSLPAHASEYKLSEGSKPPVAHIGFQGPVIEPFAYTHFCLRYAADCKVHGDRSNLHPVTLTKAKMRELEMINQSVNEEIAPRPHYGDKTYSTWRIAPAYGDCNDYAVTKRHLLLADGWPSRALLLAEVITLEGEHHLILVVRTRRHDYVLDNLVPEIRQWEDTPYQWVRIQSPYDSVLWSTVRNPRA